MMVSLLVPTRGRPERFDKFLMSVFNTADWPVEIVYGIDSDDPDRNLYHTCLDSDTVTFKRVMFHLGHKPATSRLYNILAEQATGDILMMCADDVLIKSHGWCGLLFDQLPEDGYWCCWPYDGMGGECTFPAIGRAMYKSLGYFASPRLNHWFTDAWLADIAHRAHIDHYNRNILFDHVHYNHDASLMDDTYAMRDDPKQIEKDREVFFSTGEIRREAAKKITKAINDEM